MEIKLGRVKIEILKGDITSQTDITAIVNAANAYLKPGGGVAGAVHRVAGAKLEEECRALAPIKPGEAVITRGYNLPNKYVIHCLGPVYGKDKPEDKILGDCYLNALKIAEEYKIDSIGFPAISTGAFGYPIEEATRVVLKVVKEVSPQLKYVKKIRFVLFSQKDLEVYERIFSEELK